MLTLREIMTSDPVTVGPETSLRDVVELLCAQGIHGVPVVTASGAVVGVISATDLLTFAATTPGVPADRGEMFAEWGETLPEPEADSPVEYFADLWADSEAELVERMGALAGPEWDILEQHTVDEVMTRRLISLPADADVATGAARMIEAGVHRLLVMRGDRLAGLVTTTDLVRAIAQRRIDV